MFELCVMIPYLPFRACALCLSLSLPPSPSLFVILIRRGKRKINKRKCRNRNRNFQSFCVREYACLCGIVKKEKKKSMEFIAWSCERGACPWASA